MAAPKTRAAHKPTTKTQDALMAEAPEGVLGIPLIGRFDSEEDAARAYDSAARKAWGPYARLNFIE